MLDAFEQKIKVTLDESLNSLDFDTRQQLADRRRLALNQPLKQKWSNISI